MWLSIILYKIWWNGYGISDVNPWATEDHSLCCSKLFHQPWMVIYEVFCLGVLKVLPTKINCTLFCMQKKMHSFDSLQNDYLVPQSLAHLISKIQLACLMVKDIVSHHHNWRKVKRLILHYGLLLNLEHPSQHKQLNHHCYHQSTYACITIVPVVKPRLFSEK